jgi:hypothetical protein
MVQRQAAMLAVTDTFWVLALIFVAMIPLAFFLKPTSPHATPTMME